MKNLKLILALSFMLLVIFSSCTKESTNVQDLVEEVEETTTFVSADKEIPEGVVLSGTLEEISEVGAIGDRCNTCGEGATSLTEAWAPFTPSFLNLKVQYKLANSSQEIRVFHYRKVGNSWQYHGYDKIGYSQSCVNKSVNMSTGHLPSPNTFWSGARVWDSANGQYCGGWKTLVWDFVQ